MAGPRGRRRLGGPGAPRSDRPARPSVPSATPSTTAELSVLPRTLTGVGVKPPTLPPPMPPPTKTPCRRPARTAPRGMWSTLFSGSPAIVTRPVSPGRRTAAGSARARVAENIRDGPRRRAEHAMRLMPPTVVTLALTRSAEGVERQTSPLALRQAGALVLVDVGGDLELAEVEHLGDRPAALHLSPSRYSVKVMPQKPKLLSRFSLTATTPSIVALSCICARSVVATWMVSCALFPSRARRPSPPRRTSSARRDRLRAGPAGSRLLERQLRLARLDRARSSLPWTSSSAFRRSKRAVSRSRSSCAFCAAWSPSCARSRAPPRAGPIAAPRPGSPARSGRTHDDVALLHRAAGGHEMEDAQRAPVGGAESDSDLVAWSSPVVDAVDLQGSALDRRRSASSLLAETSAWRQRAQAAPRPSTMPPMLQRSACRRFMVVCLLGALERDPLAGSSPRRSPPCRARAARRGPAALEAARAEHEHLGRRAAGAAAPRRGGRRQERAGRHQQRAGHLSTADLIAAVMPGRRRGSGFTRSSLTSNMRGGGQIVKSGLARVLNAGERAGRAGPTASTTTWRPAPPSATAVHLVDLGEHVGRLDHRKLAMPRPAQARSPVRHSRARTAPPARQFWPMVTHAVDGRLAASAPPAALLEPHVGERLVALLLERADRACDVAWLARQLHRRLAHLLLGVAQRDHRLLALES